jgi:hypothetical protein
VAVLNMCKLLDSILGQKKKIREKIKNEGKEEEIGKKERKNGKKKKQMKGKMSSVLIS